MKSAAPQGHVGHYRLWLLRDDLLESAEAEEARKHLRTCPLCGEEMKKIDDFGREWEGLRAADLARALPDGPLPHVDTADLWSLAAALTGGTPEDRMAAPAGGSRLDLQEALQHALHCRSCYATLADCRTALVQPMKRIDFRGLASEAQERFRSMRLQLFVAFAAIQGAQAAHAAKLRVRFRRRPVMRTLADSHLAPAEVIEREIGSPLELERSFSGNVFTLILLPRDSREQIIEFSLKAEKLSGNVDMSDLEVVLTASGSAPRSAGFTGNLASFGALPLCDTKIEIQNFKSGKTLGLIEISVRGAAPS